MDGMAQRSDAEVVTRQDLALIHSLEPKRLARKFVFDVAMFTAILGGVQGFHAGEWLAILSPGPLLGSVGLAAFGAIYDVWAFRRLLKRTAGETRAQVERDWQFFTAPGSALRVSGVAVGRSVVFVGFSFVLLSFIEPLPPVGEAAVEFVRLLAFSVAVLMPVMFLVRSSVKQSLRDEMGQDD